jgi:hypothetical protein
VVFGPNQETYKDKITNDSTAQYRLSTLMLEQSVFRLAEENVRESRLVVHPEAPVSIKPS